MILHIEDTYYPLCRYQSIIEQRGQCINKQRDLSTSKQRNIPIIFFSIVSLEKTVEIAQQGILLHCKNLSPFLKQSSNK